MKFFVVLVAWCLLLAVSWPLALLLLVLLPVIWLLSIPFRILGAVFTALLSLLQALLMLPARLLGHRPGVRSS